MLFVLIAIVELHNKKEELFCTPGNNVYTSQQSFYQNFVTVKSHSERKLVVLFFVDEVIFCFKVTCISFFTNCHLSICVY